MQPLRNHFRQSPRPQLESCYMYYTEKMHPLWNHIWQFSWPFLGQLDNHCISDKYNAWSEKAHLHPLRNHADGLLPLIR